MSNAGNGRAPLLSFRTKACICLVVLMVVCPFFGGVQSFGSEEGVESIVIEDARCRITFDAHGSLRGITNRDLGDQCLKAHQTHSMPFRLYVDPTSEFEIRTNEKFQLVFDDPQSITQSVVEAETCRLIDVRHDIGLTLHYAADGLEIRLRITMTNEPGVSDWALRITNTGDTPRGFLTSFPYLDGIGLGPTPENNLATAMDQAGLIVKAWERPGGVLGESNQLSMQWHAVWDPVTRSALGVIFMDADARPKRLVLSEPSLDVQYFPPVRLSPGKSIDFPQARLLVYRGDWRPAARAYRHWYDHAYPHLEPPEWFRRSDGEIGAHFKRGDLNTAGKYSIQHVIQSWRELPALQLQYPIDAWEYAFYCRGSMLANNEDYTPHTDGDNIIREDLGGAGAMREGIAGVHQVGHHAILYVEGYIVYKDSELARNGMAERWSVMHRDGTLTGSYTRQGFYHMCPGCEAWQDHLAEMVARLLRETDADGVRLDSLGFYYLPCYNPEHYHATPFGYNDWLKQLLTKVRQAAVAVKPDVLLLTEGPADWLGPHVHGALTSRTPRDVSPMRIAVGPFRPYVYAAGTLWASLSGFAGAGSGNPDIHSPEWNWTCAQSPVHDALIWGDVRDDPISSDPEIVSRCFENEGYFALPVARPENGDAIWPAGTKLSTRQAPYTLTLPGCADTIVDGAVCDIGTLIWTPLPLERENGNLRVTLESNWALVVLRKPCGPALVTFGSMPETHVGGSLNLELATVLAGDERSLNAHVVAPGLDVSPTPSPVPGAVRIQVPASALPGTYIVRVEGEGVLGAKRFLVVSPSDR